MKDKFKREIDYLRLSVTDNCNLRCIYCMDDKEQDFFKSIEILTDREILTLVEAAAKLGIKKIRITGGEPLIRPKVVELIDKINNISGIEEIYITTNAIFLADKVDALAKSGVKGVNISLDSLKEERFKSLTRRGDLNKVLEAIDKCIEQGIKVKLNTVMINEVNNDEIVDFIKLTIDKPIDVRFIELMPIGVGKAYKGVSTSEIREIINNNFKEIVYNGKTKSSGPAEYVKIKGALGKVGFISAMSNCFCQECNRIRITPEGFLKQCLHFDYGVNLRDLMREGISNEELIKIMEKNIYNKPEKHLFNKNKEHEEIRLMNQIGG